MTSIRVRAWPKPARWLEDLNDRVQHGIDESIEYFWRKEALFDDLLKWLKDQPAEYFLEKGVGKKYNFFYLSDNDLKDPEHAFEEQSQFPAYPDNFKHPSTYTGKEIINRYGKRGAPDPSNNTHSSAKNYIQTRKKRVTQQDLNFANDYDILTRRGDPNIQAKKRRKHDETRAKASAIQWTWQMLSSALHLWQFSMTPEQENGRHVWEYRREKWSEMKLDRMRTYEAIITQGGNSHDSHLHYDIKNRLWECDRMVAEDELSKMAKHDTPA